MLFTMADDDGRLRGSTPIIISTCYPYDHDVKPKDVDKWIGELHKEGCVVRYEVNNATYLQIANWHKHQRIDKHTKSKFPAPILAIQDDSRTTPVPIQEVSATTPARIGVDMEGDMEKEGNIAPDKSEAGELFSFDAFWKTYALSKNKPACQRKWDRMTKADKQAAMMALPAYIAATSKDGSDGKTLRAYPHTWLNGERWNDEVYTKATKAITARPPDEAKRTAPQGYPPEIVELFNKPKPTAEEKIELAKMEAEFKAKYEHIQ